MRCTCLAFYDDPDAVTRAYREYWNKRRETNPRFIGYLLLQPDVHDVAWRSAKCLGVSTREGKQNFIAFGIDRSHPRNPFHFTNRCPEPQRLLVVELPISATFDILGAEGVTGLENRSLAA